MNVDELKKFGASIKDLPKEERKAAGLRFQEMKRGLGEKTTPVVTPKPKDTRGEELWSLQSGPFGHGVTMYENELHIGNVDGCYRRSTVVISGTNLHMKEVK